MSIKHRNDFGNEQDKLFTYIDWLYKSGRLTIEEHSKLVDLTANCLMRAITFGSEEVE